MATTEHVGLIPLGTQPAITVEYDTEKKRSRFIAALGTFYSAATRWFAGKYRLDQAELAWNRQPELFTGDVEIIRTIANA